MEKWKLLRSPAIEHFKQGKYEEGSVFDEGGFRELPLRLDANVPEYLQHQQMRDVTISASRHLLALSRFTGTVYL